jgi:hypothetical protein
MSTYDVLRWQMRLMGLDADIVAPRLYQGSYPKQVYAPAAVGFNVVVLCAEELQDGEFPGVPITMKVPLNDDGSPMRSDEWQRALVAGAQVAELVRRGARVLTTCAAGRNRSGLVNAIALYHLYPELSGAEIVRRIQVARPNALTNRYFAGVLWRLR